MTIPEWTRLENSAIIYPSCQTRKYAAMYRLSVTLSSDVDKDKLDEALKTVIHRFPSFRFTVRKGLFWWFLRRLENEPAITRTSGLESFNMKKNAGYMFKLSCTGPRVDLDVFHALTDGTGGMTFLLSVVAEYVRLTTGTRITYGKWVYNPFEEPDECEIEDGFDQFSGTKGALDNEEKAYHVKGRTEKSDVLNSLGVSIQENQLTDKARELGCTVTELVSALMLVSLQELREADPSRRKRTNIRMEVPVNLRPIFGSRTLRNFSSYIYLGVDVSNGNLSFEDTLREVRSQKSLYLQRGRLLRRIAANVALEDNLAIRCTPLFIKRPVINLINHLKGDNYSTYTFSNLGRIDLPEEMREYVRDIHFVLGRTRERFGSCACASYGGRLNLDFSRKIAGDDFERTFIRNLRSLGIWATISVPSEPLRPEHGKDVPAKAVLSGKGLIPKFLLSI